MIRSERANFVSLLRWRAERQPDQLAYRFLLDGAGAEVTVTYAELDRRARAIAARLAECEAPGERALLLYPPGLDYIAAFFGCLYAGTTAVPAYPPDPARLNRSVDRLASIVADAQPALVLTTSEVLAALGALRTEGAGFVLPTAVATDEVPDDIASSWKPRAIDAESVAFLQYTSGSTSAPRGVVVSHGNLMHNSELIYQAFGHSPATRGVTWLPPYHDMGLIGGILQPMYGGFPVTLMSPVDFLRVPLRWLEAISRFRATTSGGPNFAYELCVRKTSAEERARLDLRDWSVAFNGAEPIRAQTLERFAAAFRPAGFRREAFHPCYGLAESTLMVTGGVPWLSGAGSDDRHVSCGRPVGDQRIVIADTATGEQCAPGQVGEIWVAGRSVARSYWSGLEMSREVFGAHLAGTEEGPFLRTGDLGFVRAGELFVTGRIKDLIIVRGRNLYPHDIELTAGRSHPALRPGCGAAFTVPGGDTEGLVVAWELATPLGETDRDAVARAVRSAVADEHDVQVRTVVLLLRGGIQKTSSGKIQRSLCATLHAAGELGGFVIEGGQPSVPRADAADPVAEADRLDRGRLLAAPAADRGAMLGEYLRRGIAAATGVTSGEIDPSQPLLTLGLDSLAVAAIAQAIQEDLGVTLPLSALIEGGSVTGIVRWVEDKVCASVPEPAPAAVTETTLSHQQRALWFLQELAPRSSEHNIAAALLFRGNLDVTALRSALNRLVARHSALRTTFESRDGQPVARVAASGVAALREHPDADPLAESARLLSAAASEPFDLGRGPLLRIDLYHTAPGETVMLVAAHHIITDFMSMATLVSELETLYARGDTLPPLAASYADVVTWQESQAAGDDGDALRAYWEGDLRGATGELRLPPCDSAGQGEPACAGTCGLRIGRELTRRVKELARAEGVTVYMVLLAAYQLLLHRYTGQADLVTGTPVAGRGRPEFERVVGYCMNPVPIRSQVTGSESVREVLAQVRRRVAGALDHQMFPLELLAGDRGAGDPLFRTLFVFNRSPVRGAGELALLTMGQPGLRRRFADLLAEPVLVQQREIPVDLHVSAAEIDDTLFVSFRYRRNVLSDEAARALARHFENLLTGIADDVLQPAGAVAMLGERERHRLLSSWSGGGDAYDPGVTVVSLIEQQAAAAPDAIAVTGEAGRLTYRELNERANCVAQLLARRGIGPGARIGLYLNRSPEMIVGLLGALKSGAAYVPADPIQPHDRTAAQFAEAGVAAILTQHKLADKLPCDADAILLDDERVMSAEQSDNPDLPVADDTAAYVMYTSGSTGLPKGVVIRHRSLANYVRFAAENFAFSADDRVLQFTSMSFDVSAEEIYTTLISGATLVLRNDLMLSSARAFLSQCEQWSVTVLDLPTAYWHELAAGIAEGTAILPPQLRLVIIAGERAVPGMVRKWQEHAGTTVRLVNTYGPTEATISVTARDLTGHAGPGEVPIGHPIAGCTAYVLDQLRQPVPAGVVGELYLGGVGLADGYLGRPALTAQSFVPHPFGDGSRLYRSGDLASFTIDGDLVYRGRADRQVKLRGYRVEPGEVESALRQLAGVTDALVVLRDTPSRIIAYLVADAVSPAVPETAALRAALRRKLPEYMIPSAFVTVPSFPLNLIGKVDTTALPAPQITEAAEPASPHTPAESFLVDTFREVLGLADVGVNDDFFDRGGQSLLATKVISRIRDRYQADVPLSAIFEAPTPAGLAGLLTQSASAATLPVRRPVRRDQPLPLSFIQEGIWFLQRLVPESTTYNVPRALRIRGELDVEKVRAAFAALERRHEILRTTFPDDEGEPVQVVHPPRGIPVPVIDVPDAGDDDQIHQMIRHASQSPFDMANGPLIRLTLARLAPRDHVLIVVEHHLIHDGWAQGVFLRDFLELYQALVSGREPRLPELTVQFADYVYWQRQMLSGTAMDKLTDFWVNELSGAPRMLALPADRPRPSALTFSGDLEVLVIDGELSQALRKFASQRGATLFMTMLSAFATMLYRYSGQEDILIGTGVANRQHQEAENLLGMMINTVLLRVTMSAGMSFSGLLDSVRNRCLRAYAHQDMPFGKLVAALRPGRGRGHDMPLCQVTFSFLDTPLPELETPGLKFDVVIAHNKMAKFDLNVIVRPGTKTSESITMYMEYNADVFEPATIQRMLGHYQAILTHALRTPDELLGKFLADLGEPPA
jgi:amino acid adenylation domain-containing protein